MSVISLQNLSFYARHGIYEAEQELGNQFMVDLYIHHQIHPAYIQSIQDTIDYTAIYELVSAAMKVPTPLLEKLAYAIAGKILTQFLAVEGVDICIRKMNPPIPGKIGSVGVQYFLTRKDMV